MRHPALVLLLLAMATGNLAAQRCLGGQPYRLSHFRAGAGIDLDTHSQTWGVDLRYATAGVFGIVDAAIRTWDVETFNDEGQLLRATVGMTFPHRYASRLALCPMLSFNKTSGPDQAEGIAWHFSERAFSGSLGVGYLLNSSWGWEFVPTATLTVGTANATMKTKAGVSKPSYKQFCCGSRGFGTFSLGLGLGLARTVTVLPSITFPLDAAGATTYSARFVIGLGRELIN